MGAKLHATEDVVEKRQHKYPCVKLVCNIGLPDGSYAKKIAKNQVQAMHRGRPTFILHLYCATPNHFISHHRQICTTHNW